MTSARYHLARWNFMHAQALCGVVIARSARQPTAALEAWADICAMRRAYWAEEWATTP